MLSFLLNVGQFTILASHDNYPNTASISKECEFFDISVSSNTEVNWSLESYLKMPKGSIKPLYTTSLCFPNSSFPCKASSRTHFPSLELKPQATAVAPSEVKQEGPKVAGRVFCIHSCGRRHRYEDLIARTEFEQATLVDGVKGILTVRGPTFGTHAFQELNRAGVGGLLVNALHHLVADRGGTVVVAGEGEVTKIDLAVQVVAARAWDPQTAVGHGHVVEVRAKALVSPGSNRVPAGLVKVRLGD